MKIQKKNLGWGREGGGVGFGGQGGCDQRIEKFLGKFTKKEIQEGGGRKNFFFFWGGGGGVGGGVGLGGGQWEGSGWGEGGGGVRVDVNEELKFL